MREATAARASQPPKRAPARTQSPLNSHVGGSFESAEDEQSAADTNRPSQDANTFEEILEAAGDALIVSRGPANNAGVQSGMVVRGYVYMRAGDIVARVVVNDTAVRVNTFVRGGRKNRHGVFITSACELTSQHYKDPAFITAGELIASCPPEYPIAFGAVALGDLPEDAGRLMPKSRRRAALAHVRSARAHALSKARAGRILRNTERRRPR